MLSLHVRVASFFLSCAKTERAPKKKNAEKQALPSVVFQRRQTRAAQSTKKSWYPLPGYTILQGSGNQVLTCILTIEKAYIYNKILCITPQFSMMKTGLRPEPLCTLISQLRSRDTAKTCALSCQASPLTTCKLTSELNEASPRNENTLHGQQCPRSSSRQNTPTGCNCACFLCNCFRGSVSSPLGLGSCLPARPRGRLVSCGGVMSLALDSGQLSAESA